VGIPTVFFNLTPWRSLPEPWSQAPGVPAPGPADLRLGSGPGRRYRAAGRGGAVLLTHTSALAARDAAATPEASNAPYGRISQVQMWERTRYLYQAVIPVAEEAGVNVGSHPNDPPEPVYRGVEQNLHTPAGLQQLIDLVPSPRSGLLLCLGTLHEMCGRREQTMAALASFVRQGKVYSIHMRNPQGGIPGGYYQEDSLDRGDLEMLAVMRLLHQLGYAGALDPDHAIGVAGDDPRGQIAFGWELGYLRALKVTVESEA
jgi:mannonate dehydratase